MAARSRATTPVFRPPAVTSEEVHGWWCRVRKTRVPGLTVGHWDPLVTLLNSHLRFNFHVDRSNSAVTVSGASLPSPGTVIDDLFAVRKVLDKLSGLGDEFWAHLGVPEVPDIRAALERLGPPRKRKAGPKLKAWHAYAESYARVIADVFRAAGVRKPSEDRAGPVARVGALAIKRVLDYEPGAATFASAVRIERRRLARLKLQADLKTPAPSL
jgi:hypothetical protein